jgi:hypothetical protein
VEPVSQVGRVTQVRQVGHIGVPAVQPGLFGWWREGDWDECTSAAALVSESGPATAELQ